MKTIQKSLILLVAVATMAVLLLADASRGITERTKCQPLNRPKP